MKSVVISIKPKWCDMIANGEKTIEVRKTKPKLETPFKCYIYRTKGAVKHLINDEWVNMYVGGNVIGEFVCDYIANYEAELWDDNTFERIQEFYESDYFDEYGDYEFKTIADNGDDFWKENMLCKSSCVSIEDLREYLGTGITTFYGWHISDLVIYYKPIELSSFTTEGDCDCLNCSKCFWFDRGNGYNVEDDCNLVYEYLDTGKTLKPLFRPPQSWCYVNDKE